MEKLLGELEIPARPTILVLNKIDRLEPRTVEALTAAHGGVAVSAGTGAGMDGLVETVEDALRSARSVVTLRIPHTEGAALALCYERGQVLARSDDDGHVRIEVELPPAVQGTLARYLA